MFRIDFFVRDSTPFAKMEFQRRQPIVIRENPPCTAWVATAEDTILSKLRWYQLGGVSDRQWRDIQTVIRVNEDILDYTYLQQWGVDLQLPHLLDAALRGERPRPTDDSSQPDSYVLNVSGDDKQNRAHTPNNEVGLPSYRQSQWCLKILTQIAARPFCRTLSLAIMS